MTNDLQTKPELDYQILKDAFKDYKHPKKAISDYIKRGKLLRVKKGLYVQTGEHIPPYSRELIANMLYGPSYVSYEYALSHYEIIPERVEEISSLTTGKAKSFETAVGRFRYIHASEEYYAVGFTRIAIDNERGFLLATAEKALCDRLLRERGRFSMRTLRTFLFEGLRLDEKAFAAMDTSLIAKIAALSGRRNLALLSTLKKEYEA